MRRGWSKPPSELVKKVRTDLETVAQAATAELFTRVVDRSPVRTGEFVANWQCAADSPPQGTVEATDPEKGAAREEAAKALTMPVGGKVYFVNNLPYGPALEHGWSDQAPTGMVGISVQEWDAIVKAKAQGGKGA